jgi:hypothetical protein
VVVVVEVEVDLAARASRPRRRRNWRASRARASIADAAGDQRPSLTFQPGVTCVRSTTAAAAAAAAAGEMEGSGANSAARVAGAEPVSQGRPLVSWRRGSASTRTPRATSAGKAYSAV